MSSKSNLFGYYWLEQVLNGRFDKPMLNLEWAIKATKKVSVLY